MRNGYGGWANYQSIAWEDIAQDHTRRRTGLRDHKGRFQLNVEGETRNPYADNPANAGSRDTFEAMRHQIECLMLERPSDDRDLTQRILGDPVLCRSALARRA
jgi:hypothetical protein